MDLKHAVYTIPILCILRIVIILFLKLKDIKKLAFSWRYSRICVYLHHLIIADRCVLVSSDNRG